MSASAEQLEDRDSRGRFVKGNATARRAAGTPKRDKHQTPRLTTRQAALRDAKAAIELATPDVIKTLREKAVEQGDTTAAGLLLRHGLPLSSNETLIAGCEDVAHLAPESRIRALNARVAEGTLPIEHAKFLADLAKQELDAELLMPLRTLMADLRSGLPADVALRKLAQMADQLHAIEHIAEPESHIQCTSDVDSPATATMSTDYTSDV